MVVLTYIYIESIVLFQRGHDHFHHIVDMSIALLSQTSKKIWVLTRQDLDWISLILNRTCHLIRVQKHIFDPVNYPNHGSTKWDLTETENGRQGDDFPFCIRERSYRSSHNSTISVVHYTFLHFRVIKFLNFSHLVIDLRDVPDDVLLWSRPISTVRTYRTLSSSVVWCHISGSTPSLNIFVAGQYVIFLLEKIGKITSLGVSALYVVVLAVSMGRGLDMSFIKTSSRSSLDGTSPVSCSVWDLSVLLVWAAVQIKMMCSLLYCYPSRVLDYTGCFYHEIHNSCAAYHDGVEELTTVFLQLDTDASHAHPSLIKLLYHYFDYISVSQ